MLRHPSGVASQVWTRLRRVCITNVSVETNWELLSWNASFSTRTNRLSAQISFSQGRSRIIVRTMSPLYICVFRAISRPFPSFDGTGRFLLSIFQLIVDSAAAAALKWSKGCVAFIDGMPRHRRAYYQEMHRNHPLEYPDGRPDGPQIPAHHKIYISQLISPYLVLRRIGRKGSPLAPDSFNYLPDPVGYWDAW